MLLRRETETAYGTIVDYIPHNTDYLLFVRANTEQISELEKKLPKKWSRVLATSNMGDRKCYSFSPHLNEKRARNILGILFKLRIQSFEFKDWTNQFSPQTHERIIKTKLSK